MFKTWLYRALDFFCKLVNKLRVIKKLIHIKWIWVKWSFIKWIRIKSLQIKRVCTKFFFIKLPLKYILLKFRQLNNFFLLILKKLYFIIKLSIKFVLTKLRQFKIFFIRILTKFWFCIKYVCRFLWTKLYLLMSFVASVLYFFVWSVFQIPSWLWRFYRFIKLNTIIIIHFLIALYFLIRHKKPEWVPLIDMVLYAFYSAFWEYYDLTPKQVNQFVYTCYDQVTYIFRTPRNLTRFILFCDQKYFQGGLTSFVSNIYIRNTSEVVVYKLTLIVKFLKPAFKYYIWIVQHNPYLNLFLTVHFFYLAKLHRAIEIGHQWTLRKFTFRYGFVWGMIIFYAYKYRHPKRGMLLLFLFPALFNFYLIRISTCREWQAKRIRACAGWAIWGIIFAYILRGGAYYIKLYTSIMIFCFFWFNISGGSHIDPRTEEKFDVRPRRGKPRRIDFVRFGANLIFPPTDSKSTDQTSLQNNTQQTQSKVEGSKTVSKSQNITKEKASIKDSKELKKKK